MYIAFTYENLFLHKMDFDIPNNIVLFIMYVRAFDMKMMYRLFSFDIKKWYDHTYSDGGDNKDFIINKGFFYYYATQMSEKGEKNRKIYESTDMSAYIKSILKPSKS